ncbi:MAG: hypothetical protein G01um101470_26 [Parcubacteria group bacterium Gr01-1014_70]|nr:MAG: hypothetical protein G01um101470_26 [Parcubacteria group bacterium Gr01-1014_70]
MSKLHRDIVITIILVLMIIITFFKFIRLYKMF